jgi:hypothetical protein
MVSDALHTLILPHVVISAINALVRGQKSSVFVHRVDLRVKGRSLSSSSNRSFKHVKLIDLRL